MQLKLQHSDIAQFFNKKMVTNRIGKHCSWYQTFLYLWRPLKSGLQQSGCGGTKRGYIKTRTELRRWQKVEFFPSLQNSDFQIFAILQKKKN